MERLIDAMCGNITNYFPQKKIMDDFTIEGGHILLSFLQSGQYFRVLGSVFNDGVWKYADDMQMHDESFRGVIWAMAVPAEFIELSKEIEQYNATDAAKPSGFTSESFGGYQYSKSGDSDANHWSKVFKSHLNRYRKM